MLPDGKVKHDKIGKGIGKEVDRTPEALTLDHTLTLCRSTRATFAKPRKALDRGDPEQSGFRHKNKHWGRMAEGWETLARSLAFPAHINHHSLLGQQGPTWLSGGQGSAECLPLLS